MRLRQDEKLAIVLLKRLTVTPKPLRELFYLENISENFLQQIVRKLRIAGLVGVSKGPGGGSYKVKDSISLVDVMNALDRRSVNRLEVKLDFEDQIINALESIKI